MAARPVQLPDKLPLDPLYADDVVILAGRQRLVAGELHQAVAYQLHDVIGLSVLQVTNDVAVSWNELLDRFQDAMPCGTSGAFGTAVVRTGLWPGWFGASSLPAGRVRQLAAAVGVRDRRWSDRWCRTDGVFVWELPGPAVADRQVVALAHRSNEAALDGWTWVGPGLPPLTRYLLHAARVRYQEAVLTAHLPGLRAGVSETEDSCQQLNKLLRAWTPSNDSADSSGRTLVVLQAAQAGLTAALSDVRSMSATVRAARRNMGHALGGSVQSRPGGLVAADEQFVARLAEQLTVEEAYLEAAHRRADEVGRLAAGVLDHRHRTRQEGLTLVQASILGGLLMALAAIQSLQYEVPLPGTLVAPVILTLAALAVLLPSAILGGSATKRLIAVWASILGAGVGWLAATAGWEGATHRSAPWYWAAGSAAAGALLATFTAVALRRRKTEPSTQPTLAE